MQIELRTPHLKVLSMTFSNIGSALLLAPFTVRDIGVLTVSVAFAIVLLGLAVKIEDILEQI